MQQTRQNATIFFPIWISLHPLHGRVLIRDTENSSKCNDSFYCDSCSSYYKELPIWIFRQPLTLFDQRCKKKPVKTQLISIFHKEEDFFFIGLKVSILWRYHENDWKKRRDCKPSICCYVSTYFLGGNNDYEKFGFPANGFWPCVNRRSPHFLIFLL